VFLAYQIGEQRELMKAQTRIAISSEVIGLLVSEATDEGLLSAERRSNDGEELSRRIGFDWIGYRAPTFATGKMCTTSTATGGTTRRSSRDRA
jgi:hypothetical protein